MRWMGWPHRAAVVVCCTTLLTSLTSCASNVDKAQEERSRRAAPKSDGDDEESAVDELTLSVVPEDGFAADVAALVRLGWDVVALQAPKRSTSTRLQVSVVDARHADALLLGCHVRIGGAPTTIVIAKRVQVVGETALHVAAEIMIGEVEDGAFHELARASPPENAVPSMNAVYGDWIDAQLPADGVTVRSDIARTFARISWNGFFSAFLSEMVHRDPELPGTLTNYTVFSPVGPDPRSDGPIESWAEPVWLERGRLSDGG